MGIGISAIITAIIATIHFVHQNTRNREYQERIEVHFKDLDEKLDSHFYQDGIPFLKKKEKQAFYEKVLTAIKNSEYEMAITLLLDYLKIFLIPDKERCAVLNFIGMSFAQIKDFDQALRHFDEVALIAERIGDTIASFVAYYNKGSVFLNLQRYEEALTSYEKAISYKSDISNEPDGSKAWEGKFFALLLLNRHEEALAAEEKALALSLDHLRAVAIKGIALANLVLHKGDLPAPAHEKAIALKSNIVEAWYKIACLFSKQRKKDDALKNLEKAIELDSKYKSTAQIDEDFKPYWDDPEFRKIVEDSEAGSGDPGPGN